MAALAALLGASALAPAPAPAQVTIWSATLTFAEAQTGVFGCDRFADDAANYCSAGLVPNTLTVAGTSYTINYLAFESVENRIAISTEINVEQAAWTPLTLRIAGRDFRFAQASGQSGDGYNWKLNAQQQQWVNGITVGSQVSVSLIDPTQTTPPTPGPGNPGTGSQRVQELPRGPLKLALWTDRSSYRPGQQLRLFRTLDPRRLRDEHAVLLYLQRVGSDQRTYLAPVESHIDPWDRRV